MRVADGRVRLLTKNEIQSDYNRIAAYHIFMELLEQGRQCSAGIFENCVMGMLVIPDKEKLPSDMFRCGFYMDEEQLLLVCDDECMTDIMNHITLAEDIDMYEMGMIFYELMEYLIREDVGFLEQYEKRLVLLEDTMTEEIQDIPEDFDKTISRHRREIRKLMGYYKLLKEVVYVMDEAMFCSGKNRSRQLFAYLGDKIGRLYNDAESIAAYAMQIRDVYTSKVNMRQNQVMQTLTIVTAIFMPLTLLAGWYGMNFQFMPELSHRYGYVMAAAVAVAVVIIEIILFKRKKWF